MSRLVFVESPEQVARALELTREEDTELLALTPRTQYALERAGAAARIPEEFHTEDEVDAVGLADMALLEQLEEKLDPLLVEWVPELSGLEAGPVALSWYEWKCLLNSYTIRVFLTGRLLTRLRPRAVAYFKGPSHRYRWGTEFLAGSPWPQVIPAVCRVLGVPVQEVAGGGENEVDVPGRPPRNKWLRQGLRGGKRALEAVWRARNARTAEQRPKVVLLHGGYSVGPLLEEIEALRSFEVWHWPADRSGALCRISPVSGPTVTFPDRPLTRRDLWERIRGEYWLRELFEREKVSILDLIAGPARQFFNGTLFEMGDLHRQALWVLRKHRPAVFLTSVSLWEQRVVARTAGLHGVPFVVYRHGALDWVRTLSTRWHPNTYQNEGRWASHLLVFGEGDREYIERRWMPRGSAQPIPVGSAALDWLRKRQTPAERARARALMGLAEERPVVMYVPTDLDGAGRYAPYRSLSPGRVFAFQRRLLEVFGAVPEIQFVLKLPEGTWPQNDISPLRELIQDRGYTNCTVETRPFRDVLAAADAFVTDYLSTGFLEMLTTDRPIFVCGVALPRGATQGEWYSNLLSAWRRRVTWADDVETFLSRLREALATADFPARLDDTLLRRFGTHLDDDGSVARAHEALLRIAATRFDR